MGSAVEFRLLMVVVLAVVCTSISDVPSEDDFLHCQSSVENWAASALDEEVKENRDALQDLLFFLHIPRTGGRAYLHCFLSKLYTSYLQCPRSYDKLHFDISKPNCRLLATHDDYSIMSKLSKDKTSVVTIQRNPIDRVFSTYEFAVEVAARFLIHPNLTSAVKMTRKLDPKKVGTSTLDIWPWKYLVPWMREDLFARRDAREHGDVKSIKARNDPYDLEAIVMPLHEFIDDPVAHDIVHNGATLQIAGLTNNSYLAESHEVRHCVRKYRGLGEYVLKVAKKRLDLMLYVGLTEEHKESATIFAKMVGTRVLSQLQALSSGLEQTISNKTDMSSSFQHAEHDSSDILNIANDEQANVVSSTNITETATNDTMTVHELMEMYETCISGLRKAQGPRRTSSLMRISPANFSKEARQQVPKVILEKILSLNSLDMELYRHAQDIFEQQKIRLMHTSVKMELQNDTVFLNQYGGPLRKFIILAIAGFFVILLIFLQVKKSRSKTSRAKL